MHQTIFFLLFFLFIRSNRSVLEYDKLSVLRFPSARPRSPSRRESSTLCENWTPGQVRIHCRSTGLALPQTSVWTQACLARCHLGQHTEWSRGQRTYGRQFYNFGTKRIIKIWTLIDLKNLSASKKCDQKLTSRKLVILLSRWTISLWTSVSILCRSSSLYAMYQRDSLVLPCLFWSKMKRI